MPRYRLQRNVERFGQLGDEPVLSIQPVEYRAANRVGKRAEHQVEGFVIGFGGGHGDILRDRRNDNQFIC